MAAIKHFAAPAGMTTPPLSFAARTGDVLFTRVSDERVVCLGVRTRALPRPHHLRGQGAAESGDADRDRMPRLAGRALISGSHLVSGTTGVSGLPPLATK